uniref:NADH-ubiquinone oxidoreductase chain 4 n=1 Tax=Columbicola macrourae TaxID=128993 RepID=A0A6G7SJU4_9NEOP|nr:NADH dehydrogenase subunit 4 [Columbicola macrourae]
MIFKWIEVIFLGVSFWCFFSKCISVAHLSMCLFAVSMMNFEEVMVCSCFFLDFFSKQMLLLLVWLAMSIMVFVEKGVKVLLMNLLNLVCLFFFCSKSFLVLFVLFELSIFPILVLILGWGPQPERVEAGTFMFLYTLLCSSPLFMMTAFSTSLGEGEILWLSVFSDSPFHLFEGYGLSIFFLLGFLAKIPIFITHVWLPKAHVEATLEGSMILAGILLKLGVFGVFRVFGLFNFLFEKSFILITSISLLGGVVGSLLALASDDMKMVVAYASVSHMNVLILSLFTQKVLGKEGSIITCFAHGLGSSFLFFAVYTVYSSTHSRSMLLNKGVSGIFPILVLISFSSWVINISIPPTFGFWGELLSILSPISFIPEMALLLGIYFVVSSTYSMFSYGILTHSEASVYCKKKAGFLVEIFGAFMLVCPLVILYFSFF